MPSVPEPALDGRVLVVVGGTTGIGLSAARRFLHEGARIVAVGLGGGAVAEAQDLLGTGALVLAGDATKPDTAPNAIKAALRTFGRFDGLYHVAGGSGRAWGDGAIHELTDEGWRATLDLNLTSVFHSDRAAVKQFLAQRTGGAIVNVGSVLAEHPSPGYFSTHAYAAAKAGIVGLTRAVAARYAADDIRVNVIAPGLVDTPMSKRAMTDGRIQAFVARKQPLDGGRAGRTGDLDAAAVFLLGDAGRYITGQVLAVDGGWSVSDGPVVP